MVMEVVRPRASSRRERKVPAKYREEPDPAPKPAPRRVVRRAKKSSSSSKHAQQRAGDKAGAAVAGTDSDAEDEHNEVCSGSGPWWRRGSRCRVVISSAVPQHQSLAACFACARIIRNAYLVCVCVYVCVSPVLVRIPYAQRTAIAWVPRWASEFAVAVWSMHTLLPL